MKHAALLLMFSGCATAEWTLPMTEAPSDVPFCDGAPAKVCYGEGARQYSDMPGLKDCTWLIKQYPGLNDHAWDGVIDFRLTVDDDGSVSDICVKGGNFGNVPDFVSCIASKVKRRRDLPPGRHGWRLVFMMD